MFIKEDANVQNWKKMLTEQFDVQDKDKLNWVSQYAAVHEFFESQLGVNNGVVLGQGNNGVGPVYTTPLNTLGMGNIMAPGDLARPGDAKGYADQLPGSGDIPVSTLPMALNVALLTIGLELLPVIPAKSPFQMLSYLDFPYAGGKMGREGFLTSLDGKGEGNENKPIYIKLLGKLETLAALGKAAKTAAKTATEPVEVVIAGKDGTTFTGTFKGIGRNDGGIILVTKSCVKGDNPASITEVFNGEVTVKVGTAAAVALEGAKADFVQTSADFVDGFANFFDGGKHPMTRGENETGTGNTVGLRLFTKWIQVGSYEVTGSLTRQQLQDLPLYGVDATGKLMEAMQNELTQTINARILERVFRLGVTNAAQQRAYQNVDLNLYIGTSGLNTEKALSDFEGIAEYQDIYGNNWAIDSWKVKNAEALTSAENMHTRQRRISSRVLAAANLIQTVGRRGRATWIVTNTQVATALQDVSGYVVAPMANTLSQDGSQNLYLNGTLAGLKIYVDPYMEWNDTRVCVGRKGDANSPGCVFMPYILADQVTITAEGTFGPKMLVNSRYALTEIGFYPELQYYTFCINSDYGII
jgi:hypothetical protein